LRGVSVDSSNNVFVGDQSNYYVQVYVSGSAWYITTVFDTGPKSGCSVSTISFVTSLADISSGNLYILDQDCGVIKLSMINRGYGVSSDDYVYYGSPSGRERGRLPYGMAVTSSATVYIGSEGYNIMTYNSSASATRTALTYQTGSYAPPVLGMCFDSSGNLFFTANKDMAVVKLSGVDTSQTTSSLTPSAKPTFSAAK